MNNPILSQHGEQGEWSEGEGENESEQKKSPLHPILAKKRKKIKKGGPLSSNHQPIESNHNL